MPRVQAVAGFASRNAHCGSFATILVPVYVRSFFRDLDILRLHTLRFLNIFGLLVWSSLTSGSC